MKDQNIKIECNDGSVIYATTVKTRPNYLVADTLSGDQLIIHERFEPKVSLVQGQQFHGIFSEA